MSNSGERARDERGIAAELEALVREAAVRPRAIAELLDALPAGLRTAVVRTLSRAAQRRLYEKVRDFAAVELRELVPPDRRPLETVRHLGRNTLPAFTLFEKRFCRPSGADPRPQVRLRVSHGRDHAPLPVVGELGRLSCVA